MRSDHGNDAGIIGACALGQWELDNEDEEVPVKNTVVPLVVGLVAGAALMWLKLRGTN